MRTISNLGDAKLVEGDDGARFVEKTSGGDVSRYLVIDTIDDCELTDTGWRGVNSKGEVFECRQREDAHTRQPLYVHSEKFGQVIVLNWKTPPSRR